MAENIAFNMKFKAMKEGFFDDKAVKAKMDEVTHKRLSEFGAFTMTRARRSLRYAKKSSSPGQPPRSHVGLIRDGQAAVTFSYEPNRKSVIIGPTLINKPTGALKTLEYGGEIDMEGKTIYVRRKGRQRKGAAKFDAVKLHGKRKIAARPYMRPAFAAELEKHMAKWKDALKK